VQRTRGTSALLNDYEVHRQLCINLVALVLFFIVARMRVMAREVKIVSSCKIDD